MAFQAIRSMANDGSIELPPQPTTDGPPTSLPPPIKPGPMDQGLRAINRTSRIRDFLAANPGRRGGPLGRRADGTVAYDPSFYQNADGSQYNGPPVGPNNRPRPTVQTGNAPVPGAFNGANPATVVGSANTTQGGNGPPRRKPIWSGGSLDGGV